MSPPDTREDHSEVDEADIPEVQRFWKSMMDQFGSVKVYKDTLIERFKKSDEPEIIIVIDKLLTGFNAPRNAVLYIDKRLKEHNILQAIARVNRLHDGKEYGLIIDYRGIFGQLNDAIELYKALEEEDLDRELGGVEGDADKADTIAARMRKTIHDKMQEDPLLYKKLSEVINAAIADHRAKRLSDANYLNRIREAMDEMRTKGSSDIPDKLKQHKSARPYYRVVLEELPDGMVKETDPAYLGADAAVKIDTIIKNLEKRDWVHDHGVYNMMFNEIEDYLLQIKGNFDLEWN